MTKKFTEKEYRKIVEIADKYFVQQKLVVAPVIIKYIYDDLFFDKTVDNEKVRGLSQELSLIALPKSREWAHDQFVETEKKYRWKYKKVDEDGDAYWLDSQFEIIVLERNDYYPFTEKEIIEAGYNPDMFERELE